MAPRKIDYEFAMFSRRDALKAVAATAAASEASFSLAASLPAAAEAALLLG